jgi:multiple sugar transport system substrate-binding protein
VTRAARAVVTTLLLPAAIGACAGDSRDVTLRLWALGREGEVVRAMLPEFERTHPGIHVREQQIPFSAAHEKLLTAFVGNASPDVAQLGNSWIAEFAALRALEPLDARVAATPAIDASDYFPGIWETNRLGDTLYGIPWYVDTRVIFYRTDLLAAAGVMAFPTDWSAWRAAMVRLQEANRGRGGATAGDADRFALLAPVNEWATLVVLALERGAPLLRDGGRYGDFEEPHFRDAFAYYVGLFRDHLAPSVNDLEVANRYQSFGAGDFAMTISGPWDIGEYRRRLPATLEGRWTTAAMPAPDGDAPPGVSLASGSSLVVFRSARHQEAAWALIAWLSDPARQLELYRASGDLPPRRSVWRDTSLAHDPAVAAFRTQLEHVAPLPKVPEIEQICVVIAQYAEATVRGALSDSAALAGLDRDVDRLLEKRRWLLDHGR